MKFLVVLILISGWLMTSTQIAMAARPLGSLGALRGAVNQEARIAEQAETRRSIEASGRSAVERGIGLLHQGMGLYNSSRAFAESAATLNTDDQEFDPDYDPPGVPTIPVHCDVEGGKDCQQCYEEAYTKLNFVRFYLEKLRGIYGATRNYVSDAIAFGNSMAGLHGGFGLGWPPARKTIQDTFIGTSKAYDKKYEAYMQELLVGLQEVATCEKQYFNEDDWYSRFGFVYYTYMQDRYRR